MILYHISVLEVGDRLAVAVAQAQFYSDARNDNAETV